MQKYLYILFFALCAVAGQAQNEQQLQRQYFFNDLVINPAVAGSKTYNPAGLNYRRQWMGIQDGPVFQSFTMHGLLWNQKVGLGGSVYHSTMGSASSQSGVQLAYAYHIPIIKAFTRLAFGISGMLNQFALNERVLKLDQPGDNAILNGTSKTIISDATAGLYYYSGGVSTKKYYIGLSANNLVQREIEDWGSHSIALPKRPKGYFLTGGYEYKLGQHFTFEPSFLLKYYEKEKDVFYDANAKVAFKNAVWIGGSYRNKESMIAMIGFSGEVIRIGYAYDMGFSSIKKYSPGSHEIYLSLYIKRRDLKTM